MYEVRSGERHLCGLVGSRLAVLCSATQLALLQAGKCLETEAHAES